MERLRVLDVLAYHAIREFEHWRLQQNWRLTLTSMIIDIMQATKDELELITSVLTFVANKHTTLLCYEILCSGSYLVVTVQFSSHGKMFVLQDYLD